MQHAIARVISLGLLVATIGCGADQNPVSPDRTAVANADALVNGPAITISGSIRSLDAPNRGFTVSVTATAADSRRGVSRVVQADERTQTWVKGTLVRLASLQIGMAVTVRGTDQGRFILAQSILSR